MRLPAVYEAPTQLQFGGCRMVDWTLAQGVLLRTSVALGTVPEPRVGTGTIGSRSHDLPPGLEVRRLRIQVGWQTPTSVIAHGALGHGHHDRAVSIEHCEAELGELEYPLERESVDRTYAGLPSGHGCR